MYINQYVNVPKELLDAQVNGNLVIFAGDGVSMGEPSNLPSFLTLSAMIAYEVVPDTEKNRLDHFLGLCELKGIKVHKRTKDIIANPESKYSNIHFDCMSLFTDKKNMRVVTTNFDRHFSTAALEIYKDQEFETYYAPALPLGRDFNGIVYLHGSIDKDEKCLVLTDKDFGRAYLTEGWATRFLCEMFSEYTVLFIGYSHNDPVMHYLSRGLVPESSRFVLVSEADSQRWNELGIVPTNMAGKDSVVGVSVDIYHAIDYM